MVCPVGALGGLVYSMSISVDVPVKIGVGAFWEYFPTKSDYLN